MREVIATIKLAAGRVGFYDELSRIHLTLGAPTAHVYSGTNCARLRRAVRDGVIRLVDGTLGGEIPPFKVVKVGDKFKLASNIQEEIKPVFKEAVKPEEAVAPVENVKAEDGGDVKDAKPEEIKTEEVKEEAPAEEAKAEAPVEEAKEEAPVEEEKPKKNAGKKGGRKKAADKE